MLLRIALMVRVRKFGGGHCYRTMKREWKMLARDVWVWDDWMDEWLGQVGKMLINMTMRVKKRQTQQTKQRHRNDVRANLKGERSQKGKKYGCHSERSLYKNLVALSCNLSMNLPRRGNLRYPFSRRSRTKSLRKHREKRGNSTRVLSVRRIRQSAKAKV